MERPKIKEDDNKKIKKCPMERKKIRVDSMCFPLKRLWKKRRYTRKIEDRDVLNEDNTFTIQIANRKED